jgi:uncharacterized protein (DUF885 family)
VRQAASKVTSVVDLPGGPAFYREALRNQAATTATAGQLHAFGMAEVKRLQAQMAQPAVQDVDLSTEDYLRRQAVQNGASFDLEQALLARMRYLVRKAGLACPRLVTGCPRMPALQVRPFPKSLEALAPFGKYSPGSLQGGATFWVNLGKLAQMPYSLLEVVTFHETLPGHHLQFALAQRNDRLVPLQRFSLFNGYIEGWATYAEGLAAEAGLYSMPETAQRTRLQVELMRAVRLVIDTGLHAEGWSRQQGIDFFVEVLHSDPASASAEVDRYLAMPGQAAGYQVGLAHIRRLRDQALQRQGQGQGFSLAAFNAQILSNGAVPLELLR